jgi:hypothetical protein
MDGVHHPEIRCVAAVLHSEDFAPPPLSRRHRAADATTAATLNPTNR